MTKYKSGKVKTIAIDLLCHSASNAEGLPYSEILTRIKQAIPEARTKVNSLRWYASLIRTGDIGDGKLRLPYSRPRSQFKKED